VFVRLQGLFETSAFAIAAQGATVQSSGSLEHTVCRAGADRDQVSIEHHDRQLPVSF
jgi:hypothetical protein